MGSIKIAFLYANPKARLTQWGVESDTCKKFFISSPNGCEAAISKINPDCIFVNKSFDFDKVKALSSRYPLAYFYGDYREPLESQVLNFMSIAKVVLLTWHRPDIYRDYNAFTVRQGANPDVWKPLNYEPKYEVIFSGSNYGSNLRYDILKKLNHDFNLFVVGNGWENVFNSTSKKAPGETNKFLSHGIVNIGIFNRTDLRNLRYYTSNRLYQGMASGRPHLAPYTDGVKEYFEPEDMYISYNSYEDLKNKIKNIIETNQSNFIGKSQRSAIIRENTTLHAWKRMEDIIRNNI